MENSVHLYEQVETFLLEQIDNEIYLPGDPIPSERELAKNLNVNRNTVKRAISTLVKKGILITRHGMGTYVKKFDSTIFLGNAKNATQIGLNELVRLTGKVPKNEVIEATIIKADNWLSSNMNVKENEELFSLARIRASDENIFAFEHSLVPKKFFPDILDVDFSDSSLYSFMEESGHKVTAVTRSFTLIHSNEVIAKYLNIVPGTLIYSFTFIGRDRDKNIIEYTKSYVRMDQVSFSTQPDNI